MRARIVILTAAALLVLDAGRSFYARRGYAQPSEAWQPDPSVYADLTWPPGADVSPDRPLGERIFARRCAICHGPDGRGNGPAAPSLIPRPRDLTLGLFKYKSTARTAPPTDADLRRVVTNGLAGSAMPAFGDLLNEAELSSVIGRIKEIAHVQNQPSAIPVPSSPRDTQSIERGRLLYAQLGCVGCHGSDGRKIGYLQDAKGYPTLIRDLTAPWTFRGGSEPEQIWMRLTTGLAGSSMPAYADAASAFERWDLVHYLQSIARIPPWQPGGTLEGPGHNRDLLRRGEYLVHAEMCGLCHTQINRTGIYRDERYLAGGMRVGAYPHAMFVSFNLTSDPATGLGRWSEEQIIEVFRNGRAPDRVLNFWGMPWFYPHFFTDEDARAVARYLKSLAPIVNEIPPPLRYGVVETVVSKLSRGLPAANPTALTYANGNFARNARQSQRPAKVLAAAQWTVLAIGITLFVAATIYQRRWPKTALRWVVSVLALAGLLLGAMLVWVVYELPALSFIPPEQIVQGATAGLVSPETGNLPVEERQMIQRGEYLFKVASCAFCHNPDGSGGLKVSWRPLGTLWVRNITSDRETGIGAWTDAGIARAIRSGIGQDGRVLHWQGMIWDHASNWDEEDIRALIAYLRRLPAVRRAIPPTRPPSDDDCEVYTFWVTPSSVAGCH
jgi:mono/diheme cytochrome c family protein